MHFSDEVYKTEAIRQKIVPNVEAIPLFKRGHLSGLDAIKFIFSPYSQHIPVTIQRSAKDTSAEIIEKLKEGYYDGRHLETIVRESCRFLGERVALNNLILLEDSNSQPRILSKDGSHALPSFKRRNIDPYEPRFAEYDKIFTALSEQGREPPRSREEITRFLQVAKPEVDFYSYNFYVDDIISYLVRKDLL
jgi:hypothetical protein